jgi:hypothetical protein
MKASLALSIAYSPESVFVMRLSWRRAVSGAGEALHIGLAVDGRAHTGSRSPAFNVEAHGFPIMRQKRNRLFDEVTWWRSIRGVGLRPLDCFTKSILRRSMVSHNRSAMRYR